jgi:hypothetical protein
VVQQVVRNTDAMVEAKLSPDRDGEISRDGHLSERGRIFLSPGPDSSIFRQESATDRGETMNAIHS